MVIEGATVEGQTAHLQAGLYRWFSPRPQIRTAHLSTNCFGSVQRRKAMRVALFRVFAAEAKREGFDPEPDTGQDQVLLWWD